MKNLILFTISLLFFLSCEKPNSSGALKHTSFEDLAQKVIASPEWEDVVRTSDKMMKSMPSPHDREARKTWRQIFKDFHNEVGDHNHFSYYIDNPEFDTPEEIEAYYKALMNYQEKIVNLKERFGIDHDQFGEIYLQNRKFYLN